MTSPGKERTGGALTRRALLFATVAAPLWLSDREDKERVMTVPIADLERRDVLAILRASAVSLNAAVADLTDVQWRFQASANRWAVADIVDHLAKSEHAVQQLVTQVLIKQPIVAPRRRSQKRDLAILEMVRNRHVTFQAAEIVRPDRTWESTDSLLERFTIERAETITYLDGTTDDLRGRLAEHPVVGDIDAFQWLLFLGAHTDRHVEQLRDVKADPAFPVRTERT